MNILSQGLTVSTLIFLLGAIAIDSVASDFQTASDLGTTGLIDLPSARMQPDATFTSTYSRQDVVDFYSLTYQATPWLETTFRYAILDPRVDREFSSDGLRDRSYDVKVRLLKEGDLAPDLSVGIIDLGGTGVFSSEYVVGSKRFGNFDVSLGVGWGRLAGRDIASNPLAEIASRFEEREGLTTLADTGEFRTDNFFSGPDIGLFGGVEYRPNGGPLRILVEYNSDRYNREESLGTLDVDSPISVGVDWEFVEGIKIGASWQHGSQFGLKLTSNLDTSLIKERSLQTFPWHSHDYAAHDLPEDFEDNWFERMRLDASNSGYSILAGTIEDGNHALIEYRNQSYALNADAAERIMASAGVHLPPEVTRVTLVLSEAGLYPVRISYLRSAMDNRDYQRKNADAALRQVDYLPGRRISDPEFKPEKQGSSLDLDFGISTRVGFFDPDVPLTYQIFAAIRADANLIGGWDLTAQYRQDLVNNYNRVERVSNSVLPPVRSDIEEYLRQGESSIDYLYLQKRGQFSQNLYYHAFAGILELQYSGVGGEVLYHPFRSRIGIGANLIAVQQRAFDGGFGTRSYEAIIGHLSAYWASPFYNFDVAIHAGKYLARDIGATLEVNRTFANGWRVGAFATMTDVSAEEFGEGSFDKGFRLTIPLNVLSTGNSRRGNNVVLRPVLRDGGARLDDFGSQIWQILKPSRYDVLSKTEQRLLHP